jgi:hypothetical protein
MLRQNYSRTCAEKGNPVQKRAKVPQFRNSVAKYLKFNTIGITACNFSKACSFSRSHEY